MYKIQNKYDNQYYQNNPNYFDTLLELCKKDKIKLIHQYLKYKYKYILLWINSCVPKLVQYECSLSTKINWILNNIFEFPKCENEKCGKAIIKNVGINKKYPKFCCIKCAMSSIQTKQKIINTCLKKYNIINGGASVIAQKKMHRKYYYDNQYFDSAPEIAYYIWLIDNKISFTYHPNILITYTFNNIQYSCQPDFIVNGIIVELKGNQFLKDDGSWQNPYNHKEDAKYEAKHQCLLNHNAIIYYYNDYVKYIDYIKQKYGKYYLDQFRRNKNTYVRHMSNINIECKNLNTNIYYKNNPIMFNALKQLIENNPKSYVAKLNGISNQRGKQKKKIEYIDLANWINDSLPLLKDKIYKMNTKCYWIMHGLVDFPICKVCNTNSKYKLKNVRSFQDGYKTFCSISCGTKYANLYTKQNKFI